MSVRRWAAAVVAAGCLVFTVGCSASGSDDSATSDAMVSEAANPSAGPSSDGYDAGDVMAGNESVAASSESAAADSQAAGAAAQPEQQSPTPTDQVNPVGSAPAAAGRSVVSTSMVTIESDNVIEARQRTAAIVSQAGGAIYDEETEIGETGRTTLTLKVPPDQFQSVLAQLGQVGKLTSQGISTEDVTEQVVDIDARIATAEASVARYRAFLDKETSRSEIANLEQQLTTRETQLETLKGQKRTLDARVDLATIVLTVVPPPVVAAPPAEPVEASAPPTFVDGVQDGWSALVSVLTVVGALAGWVLPFVPFLVAAVLGFRWYRRRHPLAAPTAASSINLPPPPQPAT